MRYNYEQIGKTIRAERKKLDLTQEELGKKLFVTGKQISNYEKGKPLPPLETLLKMAELFHCELGYLLGEESYKDRSKLNTAICESLGLTGKAVESLRATTHKGLAQELVERQLSISRFFESPYIPDFFECLVEAISVSNQISICSNAVWQEIVDRYGEETANEAVFCCSAGGAISVDDAGQPELQEAIKILDSSIDKSRNEEYHLKVARYELRETFELLVRDIL